MSSLNLKKVGEQAILKCKYCRREDYISKKLYKELKKVMPDFEYICHDCRPFHHMINQKRINLDLTDRIKSQLKAFINLLRSVGVKYADYHIFPFDTDSVSVTLGGYREAEYFSLSLEDIDIEDGSLTVRKLGVSNWTGTYDRSILRKFEYKSELLNESVSTSGNSLLNFLKSKYNEFIAKKHSLPELK